MWSKHIYGGIAHFCSECTSLQEKRPCQSEKCPPSPLPRLWSRQQTRLFLCPSWKWSSCFNWYSGHWLWIISEPFFSSNVDCDRELRFLCWWMVFHFLTVYPHISWFCKNSQKDQMPTIVKNWKLKIRTLNNLKYASAILAYNALRLKYAMLAYFWGSDCTHFFCQTDGKMAQSFPPFLLFKVPADFLELVKPGQH